MNAQIIVVADSNKKLIEVNDIFCEILAGDLSHLSEITELLLWADYIHTDVNFLEISKMIRDEMRRRK